MSWRALRVRSRFAAITLFSMLGAVALVAQAWIALQAWGGSGAQQAPTRGAVRATRRRAHGGFGRLQFGRVNFTACSTEPLDGVFASSISGAPAGGSYVNCPLGRGRLGNAMFAYASSFALSRRHNATLVVVIDSEAVSRCYSMLSDLFLLSTPHLAKGACLDFDCAVIEPGWGKYDDSVERLPLYGKRTLLSGYFQSWKYFQDAESDIRKEFRLDRYLESASALFIKGLLSAHATDGAAHLVAVHIRRGDMSRHHLYTVAPKEYLLKACRYFLNKYDSPQAPVIFVVASDGEKWARAALKQLELRVKVVYTSSSPYMDFAVLSKCNHTIVTAGTFGWWVGWLSSGEVIYYKNFINESSELRSGYEPNDYYPPHWIGME